MFSIKSYTEESSILFNASESTYSDVNNWVENALQLDCSAYRTMSPNFVLLVKVSILIAYSSKGAEDNNCKKQQKIPPSPRVSCHYVYVIYSIFGSLDSRKKTCFRK